MATYIRLTDYKDSDTKEQQFANPANRHTANQNDFSKIPGSPIAYWMSDTVRSKFILYPSIDDLMTTRAGMCTGNNDFFLRYWFEIEFIKIGFYKSSFDEVISSNKKWFQFNKGGEYNRWFGNNDIFIKFNKENIDLLSNSCNKLASKELYFKEGITWNAVSSSNFGVRLHQKGSIVSNAAMVAFPENEFNYIFAFLNTVIVKKMVEFLSPTINFNVGDISKVPVIFPNSSTIKSKINTLTDQCIEISREEWDSRETSWDFKQNELIRHKTDDGKIASAFTAYCDHWREKFHQLHANEEELNRLFIDIYGLQNELTPDVALEDITILKSESRIENGELIFNADEIARQFISYTVGCMFGRYALDREGLVVANMDQPYPTDTPFAIDDDNIIPVLEEEVFADDIAARFERFVGVAFGEERVGENLRWVEEALGMSIRKYFYGEFYKDHVRRYKKRPIYWLIQSPKKGFSALIYMHRYQSDTMARVQTMYLREYLTKLESLIEHYNAIASNPSSSAKDAKDAAKLASKLEGKHRDALDFDRGDMSRIAAEQITIDLDDGVKVNYQKFKGVLPDIGLSKGED
ncbi:putative restriction enzyme [Sulfuricurvum kujiense DSM 16994]|uniref:site-specific DNA-methyltransferase (adenine-specific) n=1 Tax=Sulfuricurvum kujiense (strain ATCC BAA-921 / DSM 16994 / JCM 11577 / YK-1) TaxID=709032 RepID=E4U0N8_SULKY|nr:BREX-1 system adenine-specific DNA-methyltransferase PglX [Sulfuricurvum kujiense]ADR34355.1 putative restriction enzyme [Sulfuricurvum kujiense DSM 16994]